MEWVFYRQGDYLVLRRAVPTADLDPFAGLLVGENGKSVVGALAIIFQVERISGDLIQFQKQIQKLRMYPP